MLQPIEPQVVVECDVVILGDTDSRIYDDYEDSNNSNVPDLVDSNSIVEYDDD